MEKINIHIEVLERQLKIYESLEQVALELYDKGEIHLDTLLEEGYYCKKNIDKINSKLNKLRPIAKVVNACESGIVKVVRFFTDDID